MGSAPPPPNRDYFLASLDTSRNGFCRWRWLHDGSFYALPKMDCRVLRCATTLVISTLVTLAAITLAVEGVVPGGLARGMRLLRAVRRTVRPIWLALSGGGPQLTSGRGVLPDVGVNPEIDRAEGRTLPAGSSGDRLFTGAGNSSENGPICENRDVMMLLRQAATSDSRRSAAWIPSSPCNRVRTERPRL